MRKLDGTVDARPLPDLLKSSDPWFRPVRTVFGPDGCLYIADWYNKIISHNEVALTHPDRDKTHGRIWRIRHVSQVPREIVNFYKLKNPELPAYLKSPSLWAKRAAWHQIADRNAKELAPQLVAIAGDDKLDDPTRISSLWCLMELHHYDNALMTRLLKSPNHDVRRETILALGAMPIPAEKFSSLLAELKDETNPMVRSQILRSTADFGSVTPSLIKLLLSFCSPDVPGPKGDTLGGNYERKFERYLALKTLESQPTALANYLDAIPDAAKSDNDRIAARALSNEAKGKSFLKTWQTLSQQPLDLETFKTVCSMLRNPAVVAAVKPVFEADNAGYLIELALANRNDVLSPPLSNLLTVACTKILASTDPKLTLQGALAADRLRVPKQEPQLAAILRNKPSSAALLDAATNVLARNPDSYADALNLALADSRLALPSAVAAIAGLVKTDAASALKHAMTLAKRLDAGQQGNLVNQLSTNPPGAKILFALLQSNALPDTAFDLATAERLKEHLKDIPAAAAIYKRRLVLLHARIVG